MDWVGKILEDIKLSPRYLLPISLASGIVLFVKPEYLNLIGLTVLKEKYLPWIGVVFLISTVLLVSHTVLTFSSWLRKKISLRFTLRGSKKRLHNLTEEERSILRDYILEGTKTQYLDIQSGVVNELEAEYIIYRSSNIGQLSGWAYNIQPWAWDYLNKHPELVLSTQELNNTKSNQSQRTLKR